MQREKDLIRQVSEQETRISHLQADIEATDQLNKILLETKEVVTRSLIEQNASITQERDTLILQVEELSRTVEQLMTSLQTIQKLNLSSFTAYNDEEEREREREKEGDDNEEERKMRGMLRTRSVSVMGTGNQLHIRGGGEVSESPASIHGKKQAR